VSRAETAGAEQRSENLGGHIGDIGLAGIDPVHPIWIDVKPGHGEAGLGEHHGFWQADVAEADDPYPCATIENLFLQFVRVYCHSKLQSFVSGPISNVEYRMLNHEGRTSSSFDIQNLAFSIRHCKTLLRKAACCQHFRR
jgi:hypothetical protein